MVDAMPPWTAPFAGEHSTKLVDRQRGLRTVRNVGSNEEVVARAWISNKYEFIDRRGTPEFSFAGPAPIRAPRRRRLATTSRLGNPLYRTGGLVFLQVGTAFVTPTEGQEYEPTDGAVTVPTDVPDAP